MKKRFSLLLAVPLCLSACSEQSSTVTVAAGDSGKAEASNAPVSSDSPLKVPAGFKAELFFEGLDVPRRLVIAPGGTASKFDVFVSESNANRVRVLHQKDGKGKADSSSVFVSNLNQPYGLAFWKNWLYVANTSEIVRFPYKAGATSTDAKPEEISPLTQGGYNQHWTRNIVFSPDNKKLFVTVGSSCNTCEESDSQRAAISVMEPDGKNRKLFATGLRNPVGMAWQPGTNQLWSVINERDNIGDDVPPDYLTSVKEGGFYGWPYAYTDIEGVVRSDPTFGDKNPAMVKKTIAPDVPVQAHSAALGVAFYPTQNPKFPAEFVGDAFLAFHGSWNRSERTGYKIVRVDFENGKAGKVSDFATGFLGNDGSASGRPVDIVVAPDGSLLFSDDGAGKIWRISYTGSN